MNFEDDLILETERALLRPMALEDFDDLWKATHKNPELLQYSPSLIHTPETMRAYMEKAIRARNEKTRYAFVIFDKQVEALAGSTSIWQFSPQNQRLEIGHTWIGDDFQGTGLNRHCKFLLLRFAFETLQYKRVEFKADALNVQSRKAMAKIGAIEEGILRSHTLMSDGVRRRDTVCLSILEGEWDKMKGDFLKPYK